MSWMHYLHQLFDHGIDSLNCVLGGLVQCAAVGTGHSLYAVFILIVACWPMYLVNSLFYQHNSTPHLFFSVDRDWWIFRVLRFFCPEHMGRVSYCECMSFIFSSYGNPNLFCHVMPRVFCIWALSMGTSTLTGYSAIEKLDSHTFPFSWGLLYSVQQKDFW
jgi:hypothetical protein